MCPRPSAFPCHKRLLNRYAYAESIHVGYLHPFTFAYLELPLRTANGNPVYTATASAAAPTATGNLLAACATSTPTYTTTPGGLQVRTDHPRLFADQAKWDCLPSLIEKDAYLRKWNDIILANASRYADMDPVQYTPDGGLGGSGVLDIARELQLRTKHWAYAWRMTKDQKWVARTWTELQVASGNSAQSFGADGTRWNPLHFL